ncbi:MAG: DUF1638 domain-containing protein [Armatimonadetes bacterium]|nr:DUF1638 domain-containing protein [Armatimonadota bacterium]
MYLRVIACEIMVREVCHVVASAPSICDVDFLSQGFHDEVGPGRLKIQEVIDAQPAGKYDAILLGYGLCNNLIAGLRARDVPLVVPRAHDCITVLLGNKDEYDRQFKAHPGTYYYSSGWIECRTRRGTLDISQTGGSGTTQFEAMVAKYGEDNARFLLEAMGSWTQHYERGALIHYDFDAALGLAARVQQICEEKGWRYECLPGQIDLLRRFVHGQWDDDAFLVVPPGHLLQPSWDGGVVRAEPVG